MKGNYKHLAPVGYLKKASRKTNSISKSFSLFNLTRAEKKNRYCLDISFYWVSDGIQKYELLNDAAAVVEVIAVIKLLFKMVYSARDAKVIGISRQDDEELWEYTDDELEIQIQTKVMV